MVYKKLVNICPASPELRSVSVSWKYIQWPYIVSSSLNSRLNFAEGSSCSFSAFRNSAGLCWRRLGFEEVSVSP